MRSYSLTFGMLLSTGLVAFGAQVAPANAEQSELPPSYELTCSGSISKILPGDFNFCLAQKYWEAGRYEQARQMLELAAGWGNKAAQRALGVAYFNGDGLDRDRPLGLAWLALSAERKEPGAAALFNSAFDDASEDERNAASGLLAQLRARYSDDIAALRADNRFQRTLRQMTSNPVYGRGQCLPGSGGLPAAAAMDQAADGSGGCSMASDNLFLAALEQRYEVYSKGWSNSRVELGHPESVQNK